MKPLEIKIKEAKNLLGELSPENSFTVPGYNDSPQPCLKRNCDGIVMPTFNANVGLCDVCDERYSWSRYWEEASNSKKYRSFKSKTS